MLTKEQQQDILAVGLMALSLLVLLALLPVSVFWPPLADFLEWGPVAGLLEIFGWEVSNVPRGNFLGVIGRWVDSALFGLFGGASYFVPILLLVAGLLSGNWLAPEWAARLGALSAGLLLLMPVAMHVLGQGPTMAGAYGVVVGRPLMTGLGFAGSVIVLSFLLVALSVITLRWNPVRALAARAQQGGGLMARGARRLMVVGEALRERWEARLAERAERKKLEAEERRALAAAAEDEEPFQGGVVVVEEDDEDDEDAGGVHGMVESSVLEEVAERESPEKEEEDVTDGTRVTVDDGSDGGARAATEPVARERSSGGVVGPDVEISDTGLPPMEFMVDADRSDREAMEEELEELGQVLVEKLRTFNVDCELGGRTTGPVVTQYEVIPAAGVKVNKIANLEADLALAMKAHAIRIVAPIPGKGAVGVEIPNPEPEVVRLSEILKSRPFKSSKATLPLALGKDLTGRPFVADLARMPHILIAGATGAGKSVCLNTIITSLVYKHTPRTLRFLMIDPKMVELSTYQDVPHLRHNVVTDPRDAAGVLKWAVIEMERRYALLSQNGVRSIGEFNAKVEAGETLRREEPVGREGDPDRWLYQGGVLPYIVVIIDELADLMMTVQSEVEKPLTLLAQKARAIGIHLIVATQRPSVNVITGLIKANFPARIGFRVASKTDSRTILDQNGADALLGNGDMLFLPPGKSEPVRIQGAFISTEETDRMMSWYRDQRDLRATLMEQEDVEIEDEEVFLPDAEDDILEELRTRELEEAAAEALSPDGPEDWDELFRAAAEVCIAEDKGSTSLLQRRLSIGYGRAARIVDQLFDAGIIGPSDGPRGRDVLVTMDRLDEICAAGETGGGGSGSPATDPRGADADDTLNDS